MSDVVSKTRGGLLYRRGESHQFSPETPTIVAAVTIGIFLGCFMYYIISKKKFCRPSSVHHRGHGRGERLRRSGATEWRQYSRRSLDRIIVQGGLPFLLFFEKHFHTRRFPAIIRYEVTRHAITIYEVTKWRERNLVKNIEKLLCVFTKLRSCPYS